MMDAFQIVGTVLDDRYRVDALARESRLALTYRAHDLRLDLPVAVKVVKPQAELSDDRLHGLLELLDEVRRLSHEHPAIERMRELKALRLRGHATLYLVLEWLEGTWLDTAIRFERDAGNIAELGQVLTVLDPIAEALSLAHAQCITHGDLGPHNILLVQSAPGSGAKLMGFGVAQAAGSDAQDARADVYAMAAMCREMLAGSSSLDSPALEQVLRCALAADPDRRYPDMRQFWHALRAAALSPPAPTVLHTSPPTERSKRTAYWIAAGLLPIAILVFILIAFSVSSGDASKKRRNRGDDDDERPTRRASASATLTATPTSSTPSPPIAPPPRIPRPAPVLRCSPDMVEIPGGTFAMGSTMDVDEGPVHDVTVGAFCLDRTEVTVLAYAACVSAGSCTVGGLKEYNVGGSAGFSDDCNWGQADKTNHPINCVNWLQARDYCAHRGRRLPSEEEWEYAARGGDENRKYPWGAAAPAGQMCWNGPGNDAGESKRGSTCEVGSYKAGENRWGVMDLGGNVWEWTSGSYCPYTATGTASCKSAERVARGACWSCYPPIDGRASDRLVDLPSDRFDALGFRCASNPTGP